MKKNLFYLITAIGILSIAASLFVTLNLSSKNHITGRYYFSENVEALASGEADLEVNCFYSPGSECLMVRLIWRLIAFTALGQNA